MGDAPAQKGDVVGQIRKTKHFMVWRFPSLPTIKRVEPNLVIMVDLGLRGAPCAADGWRMVNAPPHDGNGVGQMRKTSYLMVLRCRSLL